MVHIKNYFVPEIRQIMQELRSLKASMNELGVYLNKELIHSVAKNFADALSQSSLLGGLKIR